MIGDKTMNYQTADRIQSDTGHSVEWAPANCEYVIWPEGTPCATARECRQLIARIERDQREPRA